MRIQDEEKGIITGYVEDCRMDPQEAAPAAIIEVAAMLGLAAVIVWLVLRLLGVV